MSNNDLANALLQACQKRGIMLATAESCTGGMIIAALTDIAGSSAVVDRGFITYSNEAKMDMVGVAAATLDTHGAVSRETAIEMAAGALARSRAGLTLAVTGIAGPGGGSATKPVGLVHFGLATRSGATRHLERRYSETLTRTEIRHLAIADALGLLDEALEG